MAMLKNFYPQSRFLTPKLSHQLQASPSLQSRPAITNLEYEYRQIRTRMDSTGEEGAKKIMGTFEFFHSLDKSLDRGMEIILL
ncbi:unnamed protein product [Porites lobata]|uniref:Uncharacterized protein n=1 Tax=Porites lobata TaxID=104759 RepID=A0ABN8S8R1_9CNID|nr:unnamed protein product [Porites lobata]